jgi:hypothetical protein
MAGGVHVGGDLRASRAQPSRDWASLRSQSGSHGRSLHQGDSSAARAPITHGHGALCGPWKERTARILADLEPSSPPHGTLTAPG